jgi:hypothetical protein
VLASLMDAVAQSVDIRWILLIAGITAIAWWVFSALAMPGAPDPAEALRRQLAIPPAGAAGAPVKR